MGNSLHILTILISHNPILEVKCFENQAKFREIAIEYVNPYPVVWWCTRKLRIVTATYLTFYVLSSNFTM